MKKLVLFVNRTKLIAKICIFVIVLSMLSTTGCQFIGFKCKSNESKGSNELEYGYLIPNRGMGTTINCAYKSNKNEFDINDVTLIFSYGSSYSSGIDMTLKNGVNFPTFELWFCNEDDAVLVKKVEENLVSEKYSAEFIAHMDQGLLEIVYNHSEMITIPSELFKNETGCVTFGVCAADINEKNPEVKTLGYCLIYYKKSGDRITLSTTEF